MYTSVQKVTPPPPPHFIYFFAVMLKIVTIFHSIKFYSILDQINAALVNRRHLSKIQKISYLTETCVCLKCVCLMCVYSTVIVCFRPSVVSGPAVHSFGSQYVLKLVYYESIIWTLSFDSIIRDPCCFFKMI